jgi:hypothetical protein
MSKIENVCSGRNNFPSSESIGRDINGQIERGGNFWGSLVGYDDTYLYLKGNRGQEIIIKRRSIAKLEVI